MMQEDEVTAAAAAKEVAPQELAQPEADVQEVATQELAQPHADVQEVVPPNA